METHPGGRLRASVAILVAIKDGERVESGVYTAKYDIKAKDNAYWHNSLGHLDKAKDWARYKALSDFKINSDKFLFYIGSSHFSDSTKPKYECKSGSCEYVA